MDPDNVNMGNPQTIIPLSLQFPNIVPEEDYEALNAEWRELTLEDTCRNSAKEPEIFWYNISKEKCGDKFWYPVLSRLMMSLLALPRSSASAERIFSLLNNIKVKNRSLWKTSTINSLLCTNSLLNEQNCTQWKPSQELLQLMNQENLYEKEAETTETNTTFKRTTVRPEQPLTRTRIPTRTSTPVAKATSRTREPAEQAVLTFPKQRARSRRPALTPTTPSTSNGLLIRNHESDKSPKGE